MNEELPVLWMNRCGCIFRIIENKKTENEGMTYATVELIQHGRTSGCREFTPGTVIQFWNITNAKRIPENEILKYLL